MLTNADIDMLVDALEYYHGTEGFFDSTSVDAVLAKLAAMRTVTAPTTLLTHCSKCGRVFGDPANATCDMQPCFFN